MVGLHGEPEGDMLFAPEKGVPGIQPGWQFDRSANTDLKETAKFVSLRARNQTIDWTKHRIRLWYEGEDASPVDPISTLIPTAAPVTQNATHAVDDLEMHSYLTLLVEDGPGGWYGVDAGVVGRDKIVDILGIDVGLDAFVVDESSLTLSAPLAWEPNTSWLTIVNKLASAIGFWSPRPDPWGWIRCERYVEPANRPLAWTFSDGAHDSLYLPGWKQDKDLLLPNRVVVIQRVEGDEVAIECEAVLPPEHPRSAENLDRTLTRTYTDQDFASEDAGNRLAYEYLMGIVATETRTFQHVFVPNVEPNARVRMTNRHVPDLMGTVVDQSIRGGTGETWQTKVKELL